MKIGQSRFASTFLLCLLSLLLLADCAVQTPTVSNVKPTATVSNVSPTPTANTVLASFVGKWVSHDDELTIAENGTGVENWNAGPCTGQGASGLCTGIGNLMFTVNADGSLTGTYQSVSYESSSGPLPASYQPAPGYPVVGNTISLKHDGTDLLAAMVNGNSFNYCDPTALSQGQCGA
ncbi:MAG: hypothetical protein ACLQUY_05785 [Ktedonobacterales bacterium]